MRLVLTAGRSRRRVLAFASRTRRGPVVVALASSLLAVTLVIPAATVAATPTSPLSPGLPAAPVQTPTATAPVISIPSTSSTTGGGLSGSGVAAIAIGAILLLAGISFFIWRDARRRAPIRQRAPADALGSGERAGTKPRPKPRKLSPAERRRRKRGRAR